METEHRKKQQLFLIFGAPGTGKSSLAALLSAQLNGAFVINTDLIKEWLKISSTTRELDYNSHEAWKLVGKKTDQNIIQGFEMYADALLESIQALLSHLFEKYRLIILEGVHFTKNGISILSHNSWEILPILLPVNKSQYSYFALLKATLRMSDRNPWVESFDVIELLDRYYHAFSSDLEHLFIPSTELTTAQIVESALTHFSHASQCI